MKTRYVLLRADAGMFGPTYDRVVVALTKEDAIDAANAYLGEYFYVSRDVQDESTGYWNSSAMYQLERDEAGRWVEAS